MPSFAVPLGSPLMCTFGAAPSSLVVIPGTMMTGVVPVAKVTDMAPIVNVPPFGVCSSLANPTVASATAAALGVLTPMPCVPVIVAPWAPGVPTANDMVLPILNNTSKLQCTWGGSISITGPGAPDFMLP